MLRTVQGHLQGPKLNIAKDEAGACGGVRKMLSTPKIRRPGRATADDGPP